MEWEACILHIQHTHKKNRTITRFIDLGLLLAKRLITKHWKDEVAGGIEAWRGSMMVWAQAESTTLHTEETKGLCNFPIAATWDLILAEFKSWQERVDPVDSDEAE